MNSAQRHGNRRGIQTLKEKDKYTVIIRKLLT